MIQQSRAGRDIDRRVLGSFLEHLGTAIHTGVHQPGAALADANGFRTDVVREVKDLVCCWTGRGALLVPRQ